MSRVPTHPLVAEDVSYHVYTHGQKVSLKWDGVIKWDGMASWGSVVCGEWKRRGMVAILYSVKRCRDQDDDEGRGGGGFCDGVD